MADRNQWKHANDSIVGEPPSLRKHSLSDDAEASGLASKKAKLDKQGVSSDEGLVPAQSEQKHSEISQADVLLAAERLVAQVPMSEAERDIVDSEADYHYLAGPEKHTMHTSPSRPSPKSKLRILAGYPGPETALPAEISLARICEEYPNHLYGINLKPFLQHGWTGSKISSHLPDQAHVPESEQITIDAIRGRLRAVKDSLEANQEYDFWMSMRPLRDEYSDDEDHEE